MSRQTETRGLYGAAAPAAQLRAALTDGALPVAVYGLGKMGLPLAAVYADLTGNVLGVDLDEAVVDRVNDGDSPVENEPGLDDAVGDAVAEGRLAATTDGVAAAERAAIHVIIVPTTVREDGHSDLSNLRAAVRDVGDGLSPGDLVVVESTVPPGTCEELVRPLLSAESGLDPDEFGVAFCPERTASGRALRDIRGAYPKVVGGVDAESTRAAELVYDELTDNEVLPVSDATTAECVKVFEGVYRDVNIALANELARFTDELGVDVREAIETANTQPFCDVHEPGPGVGGHCIPYYPQFLLTQFATDAPLIRTGREVNERMPLFTVQKLVQALERRAVDVDGASVLLFGVTYRPGVRETRESPAVAIADYLDRYGADVAAVDPLVEDGDVDDLAATRVALEDVEGMDPDAAVMVTPHDAFDAVDWTAFEPMVVVDGRDALDLGETDHDVYTIGSG
jgi:UDP-N-acetyl-D-mannosaminuronic acid dehydrogenase